MVTFDRWGSRPWNADSFRSAATLVPSLVGLLVGWFVGAMFVARELRVSSSVSEGSKGQTTQLTIRRLKKSESTLLKIWSAKGGFKKVKQLDEDEKSERRWDAGRVKLCLAKVFHINIFPATWYFLGWVWVYSLWSWIPWLGLNGPCSPFRSF